MRPTTHSLGSHGPRAPKAIGSDRARLASQRMQPNCQITVQCHPYLMTIAPPATWFHQPQPEVNHPEESLAPLPPSGRHSRSRPRAPLKVGAGDSHVQRARSPASQIDAAITRGQHSHSPTVNYQCAGGPVSQCLFSLLGRKVSAQPLTDQPELQITNWIHRAGQCTQSVQTVGDLK